MESNGKIVVEGIVSAYPAGSNTGEPSVFVWDPRVDKASNLADFIEAAFGPADRLSSYGPMRITIERMAK
jgi:hypothetical protein